MAEHESTLGEHYKPQMMTRVAQLGWSTASKQNGPKHGVTWVVSGDADDKKIC